MAPDYKLATRRAARRYGVPEDLFVAQIGAESNFDPTAGSSAGARGIAQIMPATAKAWGVDLNDGRVTDDLNAAAKNMAAYIKQYGTEGALRAYNAGPGAVQRSRGFAETNAYVKRIMAAAGSGAKARPVPTGGARGGSGGSSPVRLSRQVTDPSTTTFEPDTTSAGLGLSGLIGATMSRGPQVVPVSMPDPPAHSASRYVTGAVLPQVQGVTAAPRLDIAAAISALESSPPPAEVQTVPGATRTVTTTLPGRGSQAASGSGSSSGVTPLGGGRPRAGRISVFNGNPGRLQKPLVEFAKKVSSVYGKPLRVDSGANHSKYTVNGNVSDHYAGNATDIPATGAELLRMGRAALIAAGMPRKQALQAKGGLYNVTDKRGRRHQIIFSAKGDAVGGDHTDHLHISARR